VANTLKLPRNGAVGFIGWLDDQFCKLETYSYDSRRFRCGNGFTAEESGEALVLV
jgi:hypothetical protein